MSTGIFLTYNDYPGGIFSSQVVDVCRYIRNLTGKRHILVSFVSLRNYFSSRSSIKKQIEDVIVLPMFPGIKNWEMNRFLLRILIIIYKPDVVIARGPFAALLARKGGAKKVCFDARGAYFSEFSEYDVSGGVIAAEEVRKIEKLALDSSDTTIAVSDALVDYWRLNYGYTGNKHAVIPCTLRSDYLFSKLTSETDTVRIVFAGGNGPWQNLSEMSRLLLPLFKSQTNIELVLLVKSLPDNFELAKHFPSRVKQSWVREEEVADILSSCDYGWLVRTDSVTNKVASPVKFAEYLAAGLKVIISDSLGDFSAFVAEHDCGKVINELNQLTSLEKVSLSEKQRIAELAKKHFMKTAYSEQYKKVICA